MRDRSSAAGESERASRPGILRFAALGVVLSVLWGVSLWGLTGLIQPEGWWARAVVVASVVTLGCCVAAALPRFSTTLALTAPGAAGLLLLALSMLATGRLLDWAAQPGDHWRAVEDEVIRGVAPLAPSPYMQDVVLLLVWAWSVVVMWVLVGALRRGRRPRTGAAGSAVERLADRGVPGALATAMMIVLPLIAVAIVTTHRLGPAILLPAGLLLALVVWLSAPRVRIAGGIAAGLALALTVGIFAVVPDTRDRVWNTAIQYAPVGAYVDDVTIELAQSLGARSPAPVFSHTSNDEQPLYFRLATLSTFAGGTWLPDEDLDPENLAASEWRSFVPTAPQSGYNPSAVSLPEGAEVDEWGLATVETPAGTMTFSTFDGQLVSFEPDAPEQADLWFQYFELDRQFVNVTIAGLRSTWLPLPTGVTRINPTGSSIDSEEWLWARDANTARSAGATTAPQQRYRTETLRGGGVPPRGVLPLIPPEMLRVFPDASEAPKTLQPFLELPGKLPQSMLDLKQDIETAGLDRVSAATALEDFFRRSGEFTYDEAAPFLPGADPKDPYSVMDALLTNGSGFCVHFATTFAVMARSLGVPTRVAVGYASRSQGSTPVTVRAKDLHAWPEVYIDSVGWVPYEPTPGGAGVRAESAGEDADTAESIETEDPEADAEDDAVPEQSDRPEDEGAAGDTASTDADESDAGAQQDLPGPLAVTGAIAGVLLLLMLLVGVAPALQRALMRSGRLRRVRRGPEPARAAWEEFTATLRDYGKMPGEAVDPAVRTPRARTPDALVAALVDSGVFASGASERDAAWLATAVNAERYGPPVSASAGPAGASRERLLAVVTGLAAELGAGSTRAARSRALWRPASTRKGR